MGHEGKTKKTDGEKKTGSEICEAHESLYFTLTLFSVNNFSNDN